MKNNSNSLKIVFIYLGNQVPNYVIANANRVVQLFEFEVLLYLESQAKMPQGISINSKINIKEVSSEIIRQEKELGHSFRFRNGFWFHTFNRLLLLEKIHNELGERVRILHVEGDMLLMPSFPFKNVLGDRLKWFRHDNLADVASLVYLPNLSETKWLRAQLLTELKNDSFVTDMSALNRIRDRHPERIDIFNDIFLDSESSSTLGVFDGLSLGMWLCGVDPRNTYGMQWLHENGDYRPDDKTKLESLLSNAEWFLDNGSIRYRTNGLTQEVHCLHIHSKDEELFSLNNNEKLGKYLELACDSAPIIVNFRSGRLMRLLQENFQNRTLASYCKNLVKFLFKGKGFSNRRLFVIMKFIIMKRGFK
jgi:hypothetical protein